MSILLILAFILLFILRIHLSSRMILLFRRLGNSLQGAIWIYALVTLPGVLLHEIAHFLTAALCGLRTGTITLLPTINPDGGVELGSVQVEKCDPFRQSLVGLAPILFGLPIVVWLSSQLIPLPFSWQAFQYLWGALFWLKVYLLITFALHLFPSQKDMVAWPIAGVLLGIFLGSALVMGFKISSLHQFFSRFDGFVYQSTFGVGLAVIISGCFLLLNEGLLFIVRPKSFKVQ